MKIIIFTSTLHKHERFKDSQLTQLFIFSCLHCANVTYCTISSFCAQILPEAHSCFLTEHKPFQIHWRSDYREVLQIQQDYDQDEHEAFVFNVTATNEKHTSYFCLNSLEKTTWCSLVKTEAELHFCKITITPANPHLFSLVHYWLLACHANATHRLHCTLGSFRLLGTMYLTCVTHGRRQVA